MSKYIDIRLYPTSFYSYDDCIDALYGYAGITEDEFEFYNEDSSLSEDAFLSMLLSEFTEYETYEQFFNDIKEGNRIKTQTPWA